MRFHQVALFILFGIHSFLFSAQEVKQDTIHSLFETSSNTIEAKQLPQEMAPVLFKGDTLFWVKYSPKEFSVSYRANYISKQIDMISKVFEKGTDSIYIKENPDFIGIMYNEKVAFIVTENDAKAHNTTISVLAESQYKVFKEALEDHLGHYLTLKDWLIRIGYFLISLVVLLALLWVVRWLFSKLNDYLSKFEKKFLKNKKNIFKYFIPKNTTNIFVFISNVAKLITIALVLVAYLPFMFGFFPWAEKIVADFYGYLAYPIKYVFLGFISSLPGLIFISVIILVTRYFIRVLRDIADDIEVGKYIITGFPKEWAKTTHRIISLLIWSFALVLIYPHLPGSSSPAFKGVSIFIGAIISFGSTSAIANIIAGIVITYMSPFKIGDRIKIQDTIGDVMDRTLLVTKLRTPKNVEITIPNANIINGHIINYSANAENSGLLLHTSVTIGYDVPYVQVEKLLYEAAQKSIHIEAKPEPFILQTSLDDNYVSYELNAYTKEVKLMPTIYSDIHRNIQDAFNEAGVEILSPQYIAARDGNLTTVPSKLSPESKSPIDRIVDHLTGKNQKIRIKKEDGPESKDSSEG